MGHVAFSESVHHTGGGGDQHAEGLLLRNTLMSYVSELTEN